jgi:cellulose synthase/poly-beta-1,6-N-acetylglucosamine synthase-like glycosyltransferase
MQRPGTDALSPAGLQAGGDPALSVIVPTRNEAGNIEPLLARLEDALTSIAAEVLVVDDSDDATPQIVRQIATRSGSMRALRGSARAGSAEPFSSALPRRSPRRAW